MENKYQRENIGLSHSIRGYWGRFLPDTTITPLRITLVYGLFGFAGLYVSDVLFVRYFSEPLLSQVQALKGSVEVFLTAGLLFFLTSMLQIQLQENVQRVNQQRQELDVLHRVFRHNLRNDLCLVYGYTEQIRRSVSSESLQETCDAILDTAEKITAYVENTSQINHLTDYGKGRTAYSLPERLPQILDTHSWITDDVETRTTLPEEATVEVNPMFEKALSEVITNAVKHNDSESPVIDVTVRPDIDPSHLAEIRISDSGQGIPPSELDPLKTGKEEKLVHLSGLGLWFVKWVVDYSNGELTFEESEYGGTTVVIRVPKTPDMAIEPFISRKTVTRCVRKK